jgi:hypothetical protein
VTKSYWLPTYRYKPRSRDSGERLLLPESQNLCSFCAAHVFNQDLFTKIVDAKNRGDGNGNFRYTRIGNAMRKSVLEGCVWCRKLADGVTQNIEEQRFRDHWYATDNEDSEDEEDESVDEEEEHGDEEGQEEESNDNRENADSDGEDFPYNDADFPTEVDVMASSSELEIKLHFSQSAGSYFTSLEVHIQVLTDCGGDALGLLVEDNTAHLRFHTFAGRGFDTIPPLPHSYENAILTLFTGVQLFPKVPKEDELGSEENFATAREWIKEGAPHTYSNSDSFSPTRLISVSDSGPLRVIKSREHSSTVHLDYVALSYVWGANQTYVLDLETFEQKMGTLDTSCLPQSILDAIEVTRRLGFQYLWIDAL